MPIKQTKQPNSVSLPYQTAAFALKLARLPPPRLSVKCQSPVTSCRAQLCKRQQSAQEGPGCILISQSLSRQKWPCRFLHLHLGLSLLLRSFSAWGQTFATHQEGDIGRLLHQPQALSLQSHMSAVPGRETNSARNVGLDPRRSIACSKRICGISSKEAAELT